VTTTQRDEFPAQVRRVIAERAAYTYAKCQRLTIKPHSDPDKSLKSGVAAHIRAAFKNGPRYDPNQPRDLNMVTLTRDDV
jgi:hypothetical protein